MLRWPDGDDVVTQPDRLVLHIAGADRPGVTFTLTKIIAEERARLVSFGQSVLHGYLSLTALVEIPPESRLLRRLLYAVSDIGLRLEASPFEGHEPQEHEHPDALCLTLMGAELAAGSALASVSQFLAERTINIQRIRTLSEDDLNGVELIATLPGNKRLSEVELSALRGDIFHLSHEVGVDMAVQRDDIFRRTKRLVCMDVDSTFAQGEFIDELAEAVGCKDRVAEITARAMKGELDFRQALRERVALLKGLPYQAALDVVRRVKLTPGALELSKTLKSLGFRVGLVSGGFDFFVDELKERYGLDFAFANELEVVDGALTGKLQGTVVDAERKAQVLRDMCKVYKCRIEQSVAIGDGANDVDMLQAAGLGIAFRAKPKLQQVADMSLNHNRRMDVLLYLMGFNASDVRRLLL